MNYAQQKIDLNIFEEDIKEFEVQLTGGQD
jgi:hypothetical protein